MNPKVILSTSRAKKSPNGLSDFISLAQNADAQLYDLHSRFALNRAASDKKYNALQ